MGETSVAVTWDGMSVMATDGCTPAIATQQHHDVVIISITDGR